MPMMHTPGFMRVISLRMSSVIFAAPRLSFWDGDGPLGYQVLDIDRVTLCLPMLCKQVCHKAPMAFLAPGSAGDGLKAGTPSWVSDPRRSTGPAHQLQKGS